MSTAVRILQGGFHFSEWRALRGTLRPEGLVGDARVRRAIGYMREYRKVADVFEPVDRTILQ